MVLLVANKLETFIQKTIKVKENRKIINKVGKGPDNEIYT